VRAERADALPRRQGPQARCVCDCVCDCVVTAYVTACDRVCVRECMQRGGRLVHAVRGVSGASHLAAATASAAARVGTDARVAWIRPAGRGADARSTRVPGGVRRLADRRCRGRAVGLRLVAREAVRRACGITRRGPIQHARAHTRTSRRVSRCADRAVLRVVARGPPHASEPVCEGCAVRRATQPPSSCSRAEVHTSPPPCLTMCIRCAIECGGAVRPCAQRTRHQGTSQDQWECLEGRWVTATATATAAAGAASARSSSCTS
jgi:hypothetical protein